MNIIWLTVKLQESKGASCQNWSQLLFNKKRERRNAVACQFLHLLPLWIPPCFNYVLLSTAWVGHRYDINFWPVSRLNIHFCFWPMTLSNVNASQRFTHKKFSISCGLELTAFANPQMVMNKIGSFGVFTIFFDVFQFLVSIKCHYHLINQYFLHLIISFLCWNFLVVWMIKDLFLFLSKTGIGEHDRYRMFTIFSKLYSWSNVPEFCVIV